MSMRFVRAIAVAVVAAGMPVFAALPAAAQSDLSADQIIKSLKPTGDLLNGGTRGIKLANPVTAETPQTAVQPIAAVPGATVKAQTAKAPPATRTVQVASTAPSAPSVSLNVEFETGSAQLTPQARHTLDELGKALSSADLSAYRFRIEGHTDTVGAPALNKTLSQRRAETVADYIQRNFAVPAPRLQAIGMGEEGLAVPTPPQTANARNRRVNIVNLGA